MKKLNIMDIVPKAIKTKGKNRNIIVEEENSKFLKLRYKTKSGSKHKNFCFESLVPKEIDLDTETLNVIGLLEAEMTRNSNNVVFSNSEPMLINCITKWFQKKFGISEKNWKWFIQFNKKFIDFENVIETRAREAAAFLFWIKNANLDKNDHFPKWCIYRGLDYGSLKTKNEWGMLNIYYGDLIIQKIILELIKSTPEVIKNLSESEIFAYLNGLFCGDGGANLSKNIRRVFVASYKKKKREEIMNLFHDLNIDSYISGNQVFISNLRDLFKLYKKNLFIIHPDKRLKLLEILISYKEFQGRSKFIKEEFEVEKLHILNEFQNLSDSVIERRNSFETLFNFCKDEIQKDSNMNLQTEVKLNGLARKPKRFIASNMICKNPGITLRELVQKTNLSYFSIKHISDRLSKEKYIAKKHFQPFNQLKVFPTSKLLKEIDSARYLRTLFEKRYNIPEVIENAI